MPPAGEPSEPYCDLSSYDQNPTNLPVMRRGDDSRVLNEWGPIVSLSYVDAQVDRAVASWECAGIRILRGTTTFVAAPKESGTDILDDAWFNFVFDGTPVVGQDLRVAIEDMHSSVATTLEVVFTGPLEVTNPLATPPVSHPRAFSSAPATHPNSVSWADNAYIFIGANLSLDTRTLAHEIGHCVTNTPDVPTPPYMFFPSKNTVSDSTVDTRRRLSHSTIQTARTPRTAGNLLAPGSLLLSTPP